MKRIDITNEQMKSHEFWLENPNGVKDLEGDFHYPVFGVEVNGDLITRHWITKVLYPNGEVKDEIVKYSSFTLSVATTYAHLNGGKVVITGVNSI